tara:strand:+ start:607 stop:2037 length:1431 start_codon:yes stop_codon:yes gene_type:complete
MVKIPKSKKLYSDEGGFDYLESDPEYDPSGKDPLRKQRKMDFIGGEMDELASTGYRGGSTAGGPLSDPTQYGPVGNKQSVPFEGQQRQMLAPQRGVEEAIESAIDQEISNLESAIKSGDSVGEMKATGEIGRLQGELKKELKVSKAAQETMGETYETAALRKRVTSAYGGRVDPGNVEYMIEDAKPLPTTSKGKGKGIKSAEAIIQTGLEARQIPTDKLAPAKFTEEKVIKDGKLVDVIKKPLPKGEDVGYSEYSQSRSSKSQASVEKALREGAQPGAPKPRFYVGGYDTRKVPYDYREPGFGETGGILGKASKDPGGPTFTGLDKQGNPLLPRPAVDFGDSSSVEVGKGDTYFRELGPANPESQIARQDTPDAGKGPTTPGGRKIKNFSAGSKVSGNKVGSVTPDAPKAVVSNEPFDMKKAYSDGIAQGMTPRQAQKDAERRLRLSKIKGKGKGKGKLFTTLGAVGIGAILNKDR